MNLLEHRALYAAFDRFPSRKGAAIHIDRFARTLFDTAGGGLLYVLGTAKLPAHQRDGSVEIVRFTAEIPNFLLRTAAYGRALARVVDGLSGSLELAHFRDPWSGAAIVLRPRRYAAVFEVNALPSIELPVRYPALGEATLGKIRRLELRCLDASDLVVTPSGVTAGFLEDLGVPAARIRVIPNGTEVEAPLAPPPGAPSRYLLYFGSAHPWQGIDTMIRAFARLADYEELRLVICGSYEAKGWKRYTKLASKLGCAERIVWHYELDGAELAQWRQHAAVVLAPLTASARNVVQGCAPLKIVEAMGSGACVVASDVPPVREVIRDRENGWLVHPDRPAELARAVRILLDRPELRAELGSRARATIAASFTWESALESLRREYARLLAHRNAEGEPDGTLAGLPQPQF